jgi:hypothetical protein
LAGVGEKRRVSADVIPGEIGAANRGKGIQKTTNTNVAFWIPFPSLPSALGRG